MAVKFEFTNEHRQALGLLSALGGAGIPWTQLLAWLMQYGVPLLLQVLPVILSGNWHLYTTAQIVGWIAAALAAAAAGQPLPPLPPVPTP